MRKLLLVVASMLLLASSLLAQTNRTVSGRIVDDAGAPLLGVTVSYPGGKTGTVTNTKGEFTLVLPESAKQIKVSMVGYETKLIPVAGQNAFNISLATDAKSISEVVVVGYGTQRKAEVTGNIASIKGNAVAELPIQSFEAGLGGRAAGVQITVPNGVVNNPPVFRIRGVNSLSLSAYPLIIIDGIATFTGDQGSTNAPLNPLASINPADIASIEIAKDAAATAIYGSRAANGVVFITTKKGKLGKTKFSYDGWTGWSTPNRMPKLLNAEQYIAIKNEGILNRNPAATNLYALNKDANGNPINTNWQDVVYRKQAFSQSHSFNASGATEGTSYYLSGGYTRQEGILKRNAFNRKNFLFNLDQKVGKILSVGVKGSYSNELSEISGSSGSLEGEAFNSGGLARLAFLTSPIASPFNNDGSYNLASNGYVANTGNPSLQVGLYNPQVLLDKDKSNTESNHIQSSAYAQLKPFEWLTLKTMYGIDYLLMDNNIYRNPKSGDGVSLKGEAISVSSNYKRWVWTNTAQLAHSFGNHNLNLLLGMEQQRDTRQRYGLDRQFQADDYFNTTQGGWLIDNSSGILSRDNYLLSGFGRLNYNYKEKYFLSGNLRQDQYSAFAMDKKKGNFYGFSGGWEVAKENFWAEGALGKVFSNFKVRASYGKVGNFAGLGDYDFMFLYHPSLYGGNKAMYFSQSGNSQLTWEESKKTDVGINFGILKNRINFEFAYYYNNIDGLILYLTQAPSAGLPTSVPYNSGSMYNKGLEASVNAVVLDKGAFTWTSNFNITYNKNQITSLADGMNEVPFTTASLEQTSINKVGMPASMIYVVRNAGVDPATGQRMLLNAAGETVRYDPVAAAYYYMDGKPAAAVNVKSAVPFANTNPKFIGGFENTFRYKGFELNVLLTYQTGFYVYYGSNAGLRDQRFWNNTTDVLRRWQKANDITDIPRLVSNDNVSNGSSYAISANVFKGDFLKLRTVGLSYNIPSEVAKLAHLSGVRVYANAQNLGIWTKYPGPDPEVSSNGNNASGQGIDRNTLANGRTFTLGLNVNF
ncbi:SusC/RagA family TonB-linked outer membrane protein [Chitinophaga sp. Cy-1792]|uniref:SusC/RagA family TonB-linked outer membrane protein n=1 Tax=Chitinophaga sp. Cy-1792 TaxID=2608339 RepID=UPI00141E1EBC|nr:SusC/RagA family TonB-linked outer membrane protein [Chitinophaga sp. Cy-1792]NIG53358.1 SusC/RagA family TonB-linked outer membrane protein [Chitinophaga sp. Cy-1792]